MNTLLSLGLAIAASLATIPGFAENVWAYGRVGVWAYESREVGETDLPHPHTPTSPYVTNPTDSTSNTAPAATDYVWRTFTRQDGLPSNKAHCVRVDGERVWIGTDAGLVRYEDGRFHTYTVADGLAHPVVLAVDVDPRTGDVWIATMGGLNRWSAGRFDTFDQFNSGLANDVVYSVTVDGRHVWAATASGASRLDTHTGQWSLYNETNAPMHEPWTYSVSAADGLVYVGAWGGGVLEFNTETEQWKDYVDPDGEMELDIFPNDGVVHDIISSLSYVDGMLWVATYFGLSRYDGARWWGYFDHDSGLVSNFINFIRARGDVAWICTDKGLNSFDGTTWRTYRRTENGRGEVLVTEGAEQRARQTTRTAIAHNYVLGVDFQDDVLWVATENGVSKGEPGGTFGASR